MKKGATKKAFAIASSGATSGIIGTAALKEKVVIALNKGYCEDLFEEADKALAEAHDKGGKAARAACREEWSGKLLMACGVMRPYAILETVKEKYRPLVASFAEQLFAEYECTTPSLKATAEMAASAYVRTIQLSKELSKLTGVSTISHGQNEYSAFLSKEHDRAQRQFTTAVALLMQSKTPKLEVNITNRNTFVAKNQQINATPTKQ